MLVSRKEGKFPSLSTEQLLGSCRMRGREIYRDSACSHLTWNNQCIHLSSEACSRVKVWIQNPEEPVLPFSSIVSVLAPSLPSLALLESFQKRKARDHVALGSSLFISRPTFPFHSNGKEKSNIQYIGVRVCI